MTLLNAGGPEKAADSHHSYPSQLNATLRHAGLDVAARKMDEVSNSLPHPQSLLMLTVPLKETHTPVIFPLKAKYR